jgi:hypothetical protein
MATDSGPTGTSSTGCTLTLKITPPFSAARSTPPKGSPSDCVAAMASGGTSTLTAISGQQWTPRSATRYTCVGIGLHMLTDPQYPIVQHDDPKLVTPTGSGEVAASRDSNQSWPVAA